MNNSTRVLIGCSGFVGSNLIGQTNFDKFYRSKNIDEISGGKFSQIICAGVSAVKWLANKEPEADWASIQRLISALEQTEAQQFVLISTVDVYPMPSGVDETTQISPGEVSQGYGRHRLMLEHFVREKFPHALILRLPGLFGAGLKKNILFDLMHQNRLPHINPASEFQWYPLDRLWRDIQKGLDAGLSLVNLSVAPVRTKAIIERCFPSLRVGEAADPVARYDIRTRYAPLFGAENPYLMDAAAVLEAVAGFVEKTS